MNLHHLQFLAHFGCGLAMAACSSDSFEDSSPGQTGSASSSAIPGAESTSGGNTSTDNSGLPVNAPAAQAPGIGIPDVPQGDDVSFIEEPEPSDIAVPVSGPSTEPGASCAGETYQAERLPLDIYFLVDTSGSMAEETPSGPKWDHVSRALTQFLEEDQGDSAFGIGYFPLEAAPTCVVGDDGCLCIPFTPICINLLGGSCEAQDYLPSVPMQLPSEAARVVADIAARQLSGGTPTRAALEGALQYATEWAQMHPERKTVVVLATDGEPTGCDMNTPQDIGAVAAAALAGPHQIRTFVVGVGNSLASLNTIAEQGGTGQAFLTDTNQDLVTALGDALRSIREEAVQCDFAIPTAQGTNGRIDTSRVNVVLTSEAGAAAVVPMTANGDIAGCDEAGGWYYDDPATPMSIRLCEATCEAARHGGRIELEYGCETVRVPMVR